MMQQKVKLVSMLRVHAGVLPCRRSLLLVLACTCAPLIDLTLRAEPVPEPRQVENLAALARTFGYVRFFVPTDAAAAVDWDKLGALGAARVREAVDDAALRANLIATFEPIAPGLDIVPHAQPASDSATDRGESPVTFWQHGGLDLERGKGPYQSRRVVRGSSQKERKPLFPSPTPPRTLRKPISPALDIVVPMCAPIDAAGRTVPDRREALAALNDRCDAEVPGGWPASDWRVRTAGVAAVWSAFQHFHPYLDEQRIDWDAALVHAMRRTLGDSTAMDYHATLSEMVAKTQDGHGFVYGRPAETGALPIRVAVIEGRLVVTGVASAVPLLKGDVIESIDGIPALEALAMREGYTAGSPQTRRFRALNGFGEGAPASVATLYLRRDGEGSTVEVTRTSRPAGYFFNPVAEFTFPDIAEVRPGIFHVNVHAMEPATLEARMDALASARAVIFDNRLGRLDDSSGKRKRLRAHIDIIPHLIDETVQASPMLTPQVIMPDREAWTYRESTWPVKPKKPRLSGKVIFINDPGVVSYGETCMAMIAHYGLATLVGEPTAGCNGNASFIPLPGGFRVMWTAMDVRRHDHGSFYTVGFLPDIPVTRTIRGVAEGRDEVLEQAIAFAEAGSTPNL